MIDKDKKIVKGVDSFLTTENDKKKPNEEQELDCSSGVCVIKTGHGLVERINKKIITEDGRQLLT